MVSFSTKADNLELVRSRLMSARVPESYILTLKSWKENKKSVINEAVKALNGSNSFIVRSSCRLEDTRIASNAGAFLSVPNVERKDLEESVDNVFSSYGRENDADQVLIQPMLKNVIRSGVAFSHDPANGSAYRVVNWSDSDDTEFVTSGQGGRIWQQASKSQLAPLPALAPIISLLKELLHLFNDSPIDCEFAVTQEREESETWLLQVRPLVLARTPESEESQEKRLKSIEDKVRDGMKKHSFLLGSRTVYGVMPDWNPAEIVGLRPQPLALSLYRDMVTDSIWAYQRHNYGYRNLRSFPLMPNFYGLPYIDVRLSFNSFIPASLEEHIATRLADYYLGKLLEQPALHDKIEFEIVFSCYTFDLDSRLDVLSESGFSKDDCLRISESLKDLTNAIVHPKKGLWLNDSKKIGRLKERRDQILHGDAHPIEKIYWLLEDGKRYGTLPFAGLARAGFIAVQMLQSLVTTGILSRSDADRFMESLSTVSKKLTRDRTTLDRSNFLRRYGHLRPGTYDITSPRYDQAPDRYFNWDADIGKNHQEESFSLRLDQMKELNHLLSTHELDIDAVSLFDFMQTGIEMRELAKFEFSKNLSDALELVSQVGESYGFSREDLAFCEIRAFQELAVSATDPVKLLNTSIEQGRVQYEAALRTTLPPLIVDHSDVWQFEWPETIPNFISQKEIVSSVCFADNSNALEGKIVCISHADPGYDWLFAYGIGGLVTAWGGVNSHMAIRAGELGLPAVIGTGEVLYRKISMADRVHLDCAKKKVTILP